MRFGNLDLLLSEIEGDQDDRNAGSLGNIVESCLPLGHFRPSAFGREGQTKFIPTLENFDGGGYCVAALAAIDRGAAHPLKEPTERRIEETFFTDKIDLFVPHLPYEQSQKKIDPTGMGYDDNHEFIEMTGKGADQLPAHYFEVDEAGEFLQYECLEIEELGLKKEVRFSFWTSGVILVKVGRRVFATVRQSWFELQ